jgi:hypothetical protein
MLSLYVLIVLNQITSLVVYYPAKVTMKLLDNNSTLFCQENLWRLLLKGKYSMEVNVLKSILFQRRSLTPHYSKYFICVPTLP